MDDPVQYCPNGHPVSAAMAFCPQCGAFRDGGSVPLQPGFPPPYGAGPGYPSPEGTGPYAGGARTWVPPTAVGTDGLAVAAFVLGLLWVFWIGSVLAVVFGIVALGRIARTGRRGTGLAIAGIVLGGLGLALLLLAVAVGSRS